MSGKPGSRGRDQVLSEYLETRSEARGVRNGLQGMIHCRGRSPEERERERERPKRVGCVAGGGVGLEWSGDESCGTIFHSRQKHLLGYQFEAAKQSSPPALPSIIFSC